MTSRQLPEWLRCGAFLVYPPRPTSEPERKVRDLILAIKRDGTDPRTGRVYADVVVERLARLRPSQLDDVLVPDATLVPIPPRTLQRPHSVWPPRTIAVALVRHGFGRTLSPLLERRSPIRKSAGSANRPTVQEHYESMAVRPSLLRPSRVLLIDDVVTRGATLMGAARVLWAAFGTDLDIAGFALAYVKSGDPAQRVVDPSVHHITYSDLEVARIRQ
jgi:hypothetical protein